MGGRRTPRPAEALGQTPEIALRAMPIDIGRRGY
jgi:hypothetical protein